MSFLPFTLANGSPNPSAAFVNAVLIAGLYHQDQEPFTVYSRICGGAAIPIVADPSTFQPDYGIITLGDQSLVCFGGTTNLAQWPGHCASAVFPLIDTTTGTFVVGSFYLGETLVEPDVTDAIARSLRGTVYITGHSYGAASALILGRHLKLRDQFPIVNILNFGEPRAYDGQPTSREPDLHVKLTAAFNVVTHPITGGDVGIDPVSKSPPSFFQFYKTGQVSSWLRKYFAATWADYGDNWLLSEQAISEPEIQLPFVGLIPHLNFYDFITNVAFIQLHKMDSSYLYKSMLAWMRSGLNEELTPLVAIANKYLASPVTPADNLSPPVPTSTLNMGWGFPVGTINDSNVSDWDNVSAEATVLFPFVSGGSAVATAFKGTMMFNTPQGGFSESVYSSDPNQTYTSFGAIMQKLIAARMRMSVGPDNSGCLQPVIPVAYRIEDTLVNRDALTNQIDRTAVPSGFTTGADRTLVQNQNMNIELGARVLYRTAITRQSVAIVHHGLPVYAFPAANPTDVEGSFSPQELRFAVPSGDWQKALNAYVLYLWQWNLGFRTINGTWNNADGSPGIFAAPDSVYYNSSLQMIELQWLASRLPPPGLANVNPNIGGIPVLGGPRFRVQMRGWKGFQVINGRWPAQVCVAQTGYGYAVRIIRQVRAFQGGAQIGFVSPVSWTIWKPNPNGAVAGYPSSLVDQNGPGAKFQYVESKKIGKPFDLERGRARNRPT